MSNGTSSGASGSLNTFRLTYEKRKIVVAQGPNEYSKRQKTGPRTTSIYAKISGAVL